jgi:recombination protein RecT
VIAAVTDVENATTRNMTMNEMTQWQAAIGQAKRKFTDVNIYKQVNYDTEAMFAYQMVKKSDYLMKIAEQRPDTLRDALINVGAIGLSLNPATQYAYLVPRDNVCCLDISYKGLIKIATDSGSIKWAKADLVYAADKFEYKGPCTMPDHAADVFGNRGEFVGAYCAAKTVDGDYLIEIMTSQDIYDIRDKSMAFVRGKEGQRGPWESFFGEMAKKSIIKRASKTWPKADSNERLQEAIKVINDHEGIDFESQMILGMRMDEMIDMALVNKSKVTEYYDKARHICDSEDMDEGPIKARAIWDDMNNEEKTVFNKILSRHKAGRKGYHTIFSEYVATINNND